MPWETRSVSADVQVWVPDAVSDEFTISVRDYGAKGDGSSDDSAAFKACMAAALETRSPGTAPARVRVVIPPGRYRITEQDALMSPSQGDNDGVTGLHVGGYGKGVTEIVFDPKSTSRSDPWVGNLWSANKRTRHVVVHDMTIRSLKKDACAFYFYGHGQGANMNQGCTFSRIDFQGDWQRVFGFDGPSDANLNSEMVFDNISGSGAYSDAMFKVGGISGTFNQQNQFLDYWWRDSFFILKGGTLFDFVKGGAAQFHGGSWSSASGGSPAMTFIRLGQNFNNTSAANFLFSGIRFEPKAATHTVLDDRMGHGAVTFDHCIDVSAIQHDGAIGYPLRRHEVHSPWGYPIHSTVTYRGCSLHGHDLFTGGSGVAQRGWVSYEGCYFWRGTSGQAATTGQDAGDDAVVRWSGAKPRYRFTGCWNSDDATAVA